MLDETITVNEQYDAALDTIIKLQAELAELQARSTTWAIKATEEAECNKPLRERVKTLEDALKKLGYQQVLGVAKRIAAEALAAKEPPSASKYPYCPHASSLGWEDCVHCNPALAAKEPKCNCGPNPDVHEDWCAKNYGISRNALRAIQGGAK